jgi:hypothetical protein
VNLAVGANDVLCQPLPGPIGLSGTGTNGSITLSANTLSISAQPCGATAGLTAPLVLTNNGTAALTWKAAVLGASGFSVVPRSGSLAAGGDHVTLTVTGPTFPTTRGNVTAVADTLRITTTAFGDTNHDVALSSTPSGAILAWGGGTTSISFGTVQATPSGKPTSMGFSVANSGNASATVSFALVGAHQFTFSPQNSAVAGPATLKATATFDPTSSGVQSDTVNLSVAGGTPLCAPLPAGLTVSGTGAQGTFGPVATGLGFSLVCNAPPAPQTFTISNTAAEQYDFNASIGSGWTVTPTSGTVAGNTSVTITVTPPAQGTGTVGAPNNTVVSVTTDIPGDTAHGVPIDGTVAGASLSFVDANGAAQRSISWGTRIRGTPPFTTFLANGGNQSATVNVLVTPASTNLDYPSTASLLINGVAASSWVGTAATGTTSITYTLSPPASAGCGPVFDYTVQISYTDTNGVCQNATQTLSVLWGDPC